MYVRLPTALEVASTSITFSLQWNRFFYLDHHIQIYLPLHEHNIIWTKNTTYNKNLNKLVLTHIICHLPPPLFRKALFHRTQKSIVPLYPMFERLVENWSDFIGRQMMLNMNGQLCMVYTEKSRKLASFTNVC
jgi:hypothetical protein